MTLLVTLILYIHDQSPVLLYKNTLYKIMHHNRIQMLSRINVLKKIYPVYLYQVIWSSDMNISQRIIPIISTCDILTLGKHTSTSKWENYPAPFTDTLQLLRADMLTHKPQERVNILHYKERSEVRVTSKVYRHCIGCSSLGMHFVGGLFRLNRPAARLACPEPVAIDNTPGFVYTLLYALHLKYEFTNWILNMKYV